MLEQHDIPGTSKDLAFLEPHDAGDSTQSHIIWEAPFRAKVTKVSIIPNSGITGQNTNYFNFNLINRGTDGSGTPELANRDYVNGTDETALEERVLYEPSAGLSVAAGVMLDLQRELVSSGLATPSVVVKVEYQGR